MQLFTLAVRGLRDTLLPSQAVICTTMRTSADQDRKPTNFARRGFGVVIVVLPLALLVASIAFGITRGQRPDFAGAGFMIAGAAIAVLNFHLSFIRPRLFSLRRGSMDGYRHVSGVPMAGTALLILGVVFGFGAIGSAVIGLVAFALDTGGSLWFIIATWRDRSFWDA